MRSAANQKIQRVSIHCELRRCQRSHITVATAETVRKPSAQVAGNVAATVRRDGAESAAIHFPVAVVAAIEIREDATIRHFSLTGTRCRVGRVKSELLA